MQRKLLGYYEICLRIYKISENVSFFIIPRAVIWFLLKYIIGLYAFGSIELGVFLFKVEKVSYRLEYQTYYIYGSDR